MLKELDKHDFIILEGYWENYRKHRAELQKLSRIKKLDKLTVMRLSNLERIVTGIEKTFNDAPDDMKTLIRLRYWEAETKRYEWKDIVEAIGITKTRINKKKLRLLILTAENIGYIY